MAITDWNTEAIAKADVDAKIRNQTAPDSITKSNHSDALHAAIELLFHSNASARTAAELDAYSIAQLGDVVFSGISDNNEGAAADVDRTITADEARKFFDPASFLTIDTYRLGNKIAEARPAGATAADNLTALDTAGAAASAGDIILIPPKMQLEGEFVPVNGVIYDFAPGSRVYTTVTNERPLKITTAGTYTITGRGHFDNTFTEDDSAGERAHGVMIDGNSIVVFIEAKRIEANSSNGAAVFTDGSTSEITLRVDEVVSHEYDALWMDNLSGTPTVLDVWVGFAGAYGGGQSNIVETLGTAIRGSIIIENAECSGRFFETTNSPDLAVSVTNAQLVQKSFPAWIPENTYNKNDKIEQVSVAGNLELWVKKIDGPSGVAPWDTEEEALWTSLGAKQISWGKISNANVSVGLATVNNADLEAHLVMAGDSTFSADVLEGVVDPGGTTTFPSTYGTVSCGVLRGRVSITTEYPLQLNIGQIITPTYDAWSDDTTYAEGETVTHARLSDSKVMVWRSETARTVGPGVTWNAAEEANWREWGEPLSIYSSAASVRKLRLQGGGRDDR
jgi:hypothetical protein